MFVHCHIAVAIHFMNFYAFVMTIYQSCIKPANSTILHLFIINNIFYILPNNINSDIDSGIILPINTDQNTIYYNNIQILISKIESLKRVIKFYFFIFNSFKDGDIINIIPFNFLFNFKVFTTNFKIRIFKYTSLLTTNFNYFK